MSLIADSLKKANKAYLERGASPHARNRNPLALKKNRSGSGLSTITKITFLVGLPGMILIYLVQAGVFSGKQILNNDRPLSKISEPKQKVFTSKSASLHTELQNRNLVIPPALAGKEPGTAKLVKPTVNTKLPQSADPKIVQSTASEPKQTIVEKVSAKAFVPQKKITQPKVIPPAPDVQVKQVEVAVEDIVVPVALTKPVMMAEMAPAKLVVPEPDKIIGEEKSPVKLAEENHTVKVSAMTKLKEVSEPPAPTLPVKMVEGMKPSTVSAAETMQPTELKSPGEIQAEDNPVIVEQVAEAKVDMAKAKAIQGGSQTTEKKPGADDLALLVTPRQPVQGGEIFKTSDYYFNRAIFFQQAKDWEQSLKNYQMAAELDQNNADIYNNMGVVNKEMRRFDQAIEQLLRAVYLNPDYDKAYNNLGVVYYLKNQFDGAIRNYRKAIDLDQKNLEAFNNLAIVHKKKNEMEQAKSVLNQALAMNAKHAGTNYNLAVLHEELNEVTQAIYYYQRFVRFGRESYPDLVFTVQDHLATLNR